MRLTRRRFLEAASACVAVALAAPVVSAVPTCDCSEPSVFWIASRGGWTNRVWGGQVCMQCMPRTLNIPELPNGFFRKQVTWHINADGKTGWYRVVDIGFVTTRPDWSPIGLSELFPSG